MDENLGFATTWETTRRRVEAVTGWEIFFAIKHGEGIYEGITEDQKVEFLANVIEVMEPAYPAKED